MPKEPEIINFQDQLDQAAETFVKDQLKKTGILGVGNYDPVDVKGNLVDQRTEGVKQSFIIALNEQQAQNERENSMNGMRDMLTRIQLKLGHFHDERTLRSPRSIFSGPTHPWHYTWVVDQKKYGTDTLGSRVMTQPDVQFVEGIIYEGYRRADMRKLESLYCTGYDAALLQLPRTPAQLTVYRNKGVPLPPPLPPFLRAKFGTIMPAIVQTDGSFWVGGQCLYVIERSHMDEKNRRNSIAANGGSAHQYDAAKGIMVEADSQAGYYDIELDSMFGGGKR